MSEDTGMSRRPLWSLKNLLAIFAVSLITFFCNLIWQAYEKQNQQTLDQTKVMQVLAERIKELERAEVQWATLAELTKKQQELETRQEVMRRVWEYEYGRKIPTGTPRDDMPELPVPNESLRPIDPDQFRHMQQQRYPTKK
jgi:low affinity Fe/Cu permease